MNCITWNVDESDEIKGFTEEDRKRFDELMNRFENEEEAIKMVLLVVLRKVKCILWVI